MQKGLLHHPKCPIVSLLKLNDDLFESLQHVKSYVYAFYHFAFIIASHVQGNLFMSE